MCLCLCAGVKKIIYRQYNITAWPRVWNYFTAAYMPKPARSSRVFPVVLFVFLPHRCIADCRQWCNGTQQIGVRALDIFSKHVSFSFSHVVCFLCHFPFTHAASLADRGPACSLLGHVACFLLSSHAGWKCHTGVTQGVSYCDWQPVFPSTATASLFLHVEYTFSEDVPCLCIHEFHFSVFQTVCKDTFIPSPT